ncbi:MAG: pyridoxal-dependent decarboxylase [Acidimicrobiales bacterium]
MASTTSSYHLDPEGFRRVGGDVLDWVAGYLASIESLPVQSSVEPGWVRAQLPAHPPEEPEPWDVIIADLDRIIVPGLTHWQSPSFFGFFPANASGPSVLGELVSAGVGVQGMLWATSPACTELETHVLDWLVELLDLPARFLSSGDGGGVIQDSASSATLCAILAARDRARAGVGGDLRRLVAYASSEAHSSVEKGLRVAGLTADQLRVIDVDASYALRADQLELAIETDVAAGLVPFMVVATVGTTSSMAFDPVATIGEIADRHSLWLHVDAAMAGSAAVVPELRLLVNAGLERADSWCFDPHKWLFTNFDCDVLFLADRAPLIESLSVLPEYLRNQDSARGAVIDYRDWHVPLGRRFRALKLWFVLRHYGAAGLRHHLREHVAFAQWLAAELEADPRFDVLAAVELNLVCFALRDGDDATESLLRAVNATGDVYLTHTRLDGRFAIRASIGQTTTERRHVDALWGLLSAKAAAGSL